MQNTQKTELGRKGEKIAYNYLLKKGYSILATNWRYKHKEIDILAQIDSTLVVVEVKTRSHSFFERPQDAVTKQKQKFLVQATNAYISTVDFEGDVRFDIISIITNSNEEIITHLEDAFYPLL